MALRTNGKTVYQIIQEEFGCEHPQTEIRYRLDSLGRRQYIEQCLACGAAVTSALPYSNVPNKDRARPFDESFRNTFLSQQEERREELYAIHFEERKAQRETENTQWWNDYSNYLSSPQWRKKRYQVLKRDNFLCQSCRKQPATQVHHLSGAYKYIPNEPLFMLISVCDECHDFITATDRGSTIQRNDEQKQIA